MLSLILGGARSGKSHFAQSLCGDARVLYIATAQTEGDAEMQERVAHHRASRPASWLTVEAPEDVPGVVRRAPSEAIVLVDCATVWISNLLWKWRALENDEQDRRLTTALDELAQEARTRRVIVVSNEVGSGIVPENAVARRFRDRQGLANQQLAREAGYVALLVAGIPLVVKDSGVKDADP